MLKWEITKGRTPKAEIQTYLDYTTLINNIKIYEVKTARRILEMCHANSRLEGNRNLQLLYQRRYVTTNGYVPAMASTSALSHYEVTEYTQNMNYVKVQRVTLYISPPALHSQKRVDDVYFGAVLNMKICTKIDITQWLQITVFTLSSNVFCLHRRMTLNRFQYSGLVFQNSHYSCTGEFQLPGDFCI